MPYRQTNYTRYIYPLKLHEYLACGKPVVATPLENLREFADVLRFAETPAEWEAAVGAAVDDTSPSACARRIAVAQDNSWLPRVDHVGGLFVDTLAGNRAEGKARDFAND